MMELSTLDTIREQLALGNKLSSLRRVITIDLSTRDKTETITAKVERAMLPQDPDTPAPYEQEAAAWLAAHLGDYTTIRVQGRGGMIATLPHALKDTMLPRIVAAFNS